MKATRLWSLWQAILLSLALGFTQRGKQRFVEWVTALALNVEEHTITQSLVGLDRAGDWKALESFAEYGAWDLRLLADGPCLTASTACPTASGTATTSGPATTPRSIAPAPTSGAPAPSTSTPPAAPTAPPPSGPTTGSSWVPCCPRPASPPCSCPSPGSCTSARRSCPTTQKGPPIAFRTKCELVVELVRQHAKACPGKHLGVFDGGFALRSVVRPLVKPDEPEQPRIEFLTRLRHDARLYALPPANVGQGQRGPMPKWGRRLPPPRQGGRWAGPWQTGKAFIYGRVRQVRWKEVLCLWRVLGHDVPVKAVVAEVEGYKKRFTLVSSASAS